MQASHYAIAGHGFVVLYEIDFSHFFFEFPLGEAFEEITTGVGEYSGFDNYDSVELGFDDVHNKSELVWW